jgi:hypothetical protein
VREPFNLEAVAERVYRTDIFREAVAGENSAAPASDYKPEGNESGAGPPRFFGGESFDPAAALAYLNRLPIHHAGAELEAFAALNR